MLVLSHSRLLHLMFFARAPVLVVVATVVVIAIFDAGSGISGGALALLLVNFCCSARAETRRRRRRAGSLQHDGRHKILTFGQVRTLSLRADAAATEQRQRALCLGLRHLVVIRPARFCQLQQESLRSVELSFR